MPLLRMNMNLVDDNMPMAIGPILIITKMHGLDALNGEYAYAEHTLLVDTIFEYHNYNHNHSMLISK